jgi:predicted HTH transcriptional regulator
MGAFPTSDMPGHKMLHDRAFAALDRCQENQGIDFKESAPWNDMQWRIIKTALGMANLRDGGMIIIGASEREQTWELIGISQEHLNTYDVDDIIDTTNKYASPHVDLDIVLVEYRDHHKFLVMYVREFIDTPIVCKKNSADPQKTLIEGAVYIRPPGKARTTRVMNAAQMHDLIELAAEKRARRILEVSSRIGLKVRPIATEQFDRELEGL